MPEDPFAILGLKSNAIKSEVRDAHHALALKWHPDKNPNNSNAEEKFKSIQAAYETLIDLVPETRPEISDPIRVDQPIPRKVPVESEPPKDRMAYLQNLFETMNGSIYRDVFGGEV